MLPEQDRNLKYYSISTNVLPFKIDFIMHDSSLIIHNVYVYTVFIGNFSFFVNACVIVKKAVFKYYPFKFISLHVYIKIVFFPICLYYIHNRNNTCVGKIYIKWFRRCRESGRNVGFKRKRQ